MADEPSITVAPNGPYLVNSTRLVVRTPVLTDKGEPVAWITSEPVPTNERYALCRCGLSERKPFCDGTHARVGFDGTETADTIYAENAKRYDGPRVTVRDDRSICTHAGFCSNAATNVWKMVARTADTDVLSEMMGMIERCPSGALTYAVDHGDTPVEPDLPADVAVIPDGPLQVTGRVAVTRSDGALLESRNRVTLCRCGHSAHKPLCDGSHAEAGFTHTPEGAKGPVVQL